MAGAILFSGAAVMAALLLFPASVPADEARIPHVEDAMLDPDYWAGRIKKPRRTILGPRGIARANARVMRRGYRVRPEGELARIPGRRIRKAVERQLESLTHWRKYDRDNKRMRDPGFYRRMAALAEPGKIPERIDVEFGLTTGKTRVRVVPTGMLVQRKPDEPQFDILQSSVLDAATPLAVYHRSHDGDWRTVQTPVCFGWVRLDLIAFASREEVAEFGKKAHPLVALQHSVTVYADPGFMVPLTHLSMGGRLPFAGRVSRGYVVQVPERGKDGRLVSGRGYVPASDRVSRGFLKMTVRNILGLAFRQLGDPYGWGGTGVGTDCSRFIANIFSIFGLDLPRTSFNQVKSMDYRLPPKPVEERRRFLDALPAGRTLLQFPGHVGLYLGKVGNRYYMIHSLTAYRIVEDGKEREIRVDRTIVSDLSLGEGTTKGSYIKILEAAGVM